MPPPAEFARESTHAARECVGTPVAPCRTPIVPSRTFIAPPKVQSDRTGSAIVPIFTSNGSAVTPIGTSNGSAAACSVNSTPVVPTPSADRLRSVGTSATTRSGGSIVVPVESRSSNVPPPSAKSAAWSAGGAGLSPQRSGMKSVASCGVLPSARATTGSSKLSQEISGSACTPGNLPKWAVLSEEQWQSFADKPHERLLQPQRQACVEKTSDRLVQAQRHQQQSEKAMRACRTPPQQSRDARMRMSSACIPETAALGPVADSRTPPLPCAPPSLTTQQCN